MKKRIMFIVPLLASAILHASPDEPISSDNSDATWNTVTVIDYKPGTVNEARELIKKFETASVAAGTPLPVVYWFESGKYDLVLTWEHKNKPTSTESGWCLTGAEWWSALVELEGSEEAARQVQNNYQELIASSVSNVGRKAK